MGSPSIPAQPAPPDYAAANRQGIYTDIETLPIRNLINQAASLGQRVEYVDPATGATRVADFTGMGNAAAATQAQQILSDANAAMQRQQLSLRQELGVANAQQTAAEIAAADPQAAATRAALTGQVLGNLNGPPIANQPNAQLQQAFGNLNQVAGAAPTGAGTANLLQGLMGQSNQQLGDLSAQAAGGDNGNDLLRGLMAQAQDPTSAARLGSLYGEAGALPTEFGDMNALALNPALIGAVRDYSLGGQLNQQELRSVTDDVRSGQAARGNYLGDAAMLQEVLRQADAGDQKKQQRLNNLLAIQGQAFGQSDALRNESQAAKLARLGSMTGLQGQGFDQNQRVVGAIAGLEGQRFGQAGAALDRQAALSGQRTGTLAGLAQQLFGQDQQAYNSQLNAAGAAMNGAGAVAQNQQQTNAINFGQNQQQLANASAMVLGQPITNQFGSLQGAQQGAVGYTPLNYQGAGQLNPNAGTANTNYAQGNFGTLGNMWGTQANIAGQGNPWLSVLGTVGGAALGAMI